MPHAARKGDPIGHSPAMSWLVQGLLLGAAVGVGAALVIGTGGLAAVAIVGGLAAGGAGIGELLSSMSFAPKEVCGMIITGSPDILINNRPAARAHVDMTICSKHSGTPPIATGSATVIFNKMPAARVDDSITCGAIIVDGSPDVIIEGGTVQTDEIQPENLVPAWVHWSLLAVGIGAAVILGGPIVAALGLVGSIGGGMGCGWLGGKIFGEGS
ncbi:MAG: PAAR domain-containing protein, partial [Geobacteraceae bacterium]|nr:PAAR domain-containing protein [Geobacteraceae bacterium]